MSPMELVALSQHLHHLCRQAEHLLNEEDESPVAQELLSRVRLLQDATNLPVY